MSIEILTFVEYYVPGFKFGGPVKSIHSMVENLGDEFQFKIITRDRDVGDAEPYEDITPDSWQQVGKAQVYYMSSDRMTLRNLRSIIATTPHDLVYLNSFFNPRFTLYPLLLRRLKLIDAKPTVLAPRNELSKGALGIKWTKKRLFRTTAWAIGLYRDILWHASNEPERLAIERRIFGRDSSENPNARVHVAQDMTPKIAAESVPPRQDTKSPGALHLVFLSRISSMKNLPFALRVLSGCKGRITYDIYGPIDRTNDWEECQRIIETLPDNIEVEYRGPVDPSQVSSTFARYDAFFLPTKGENFGHVIVESLAAGCPVLLSDRTPWRGLEQIKAGWDIPLNRPDDFRQAVDTLVKMDNEDMLRLREGARAYAATITDDSNTMEQNRSLFRKAWKLGKRR